MSENTAINNLIQLAQSRKPIFHDPDDDQTVRVDRFAERYALPALANARVVRQIEVHEAPVPAPLVDRKSPSVYVDRKSPAVYVDRKSPTPSVYEAPAMSAPVAVHAPMPYAMPATPPPPAAPPLSTELRRAMRKLAAPIAFVALFAVSLSSYLAFAGSGSVQAPAAAAQAVAPAAPAPMSVAQAPAPPPPTPTVAVEPIPAAAEPAHAAVNSIGELPAAGPAAEVTDDIEMAPEVVAQPKAERRHHDRERHEVAKVEPKPEKVEKIEKIEKKPAKADATPDAEIPVNTANKTSSENGKIVVSSNVPAMIYLDGRATKLTTPSQFTVPAGHHKITLLEPGTGKAKTQDFDVAAGKVASVAKQF